jgi:pyruvate dehydrogenase E2 component (dihydrolipoamide acetyltransferase)
VAAHTPPPAASSDILPLTAMRRIVAQRMLASKQTVPCYYLEIDADVSDLVCLRNKMNLKSQNGKISFNDFVLRACGLALRMFPSVNSEWVEGRGIRRRGRAGAGLAVALDPEGLMVPVVRDPDQKTLWQIAKESADLAQRARAKRLTPDEYQGGSMTVSNLGMFGITRFIPVVNPGESCIMGLGTVRDTVVYRQGGIQVRKMMALTLAVDHRLVDGAVGAQFLEAIRDLLEAPQRLAEE